MHLYNCTIRFALVALITIFCACGGDSAADKSDGDRLENDSSDGDLDGDIEHSEQDIESPEAHCTDGPCCTEMRAFLDSSRICEVEAEVEFRCAAPHGCGGHIDRRSRGRHCSGISALCDGELGEFSDWLTIIDCEGLEACDPDGPEGPVCLVNRQQCDPSYCGAGSGPCCDDETEAFYGTETRCEETLIGSDFRCSMESCGGDVEGLAFDRYCDGENSECSGERMEVA